MMLEGISRKELDEYLLKEEVKEAIVDLPEEDEPKLVGLEDLL